MGLRRRRLLGGLATCPCSPPATDGLVASDTIGGRRFDGLRLLDLAGDRVAVAAMDADDRTVQTEPAVSLHERTTPVRIRATRTRLVHERLVVTLTFARLDDAADSALISLTDLRTNARLDGGPTRVSEIVHLARVPVGDTVALQYGAYLWRLSDIPCTR